MVRCSRMRGRNPFASQHKSSLLMISDILIGKYAGLVTPGKDDQEYRLCNDKDIGAIMEAA